MKSLLAVILVDPGITPATWYSTLFENFFHPTIVLWLDGLAMASLKDSLSASLSNVTVIFSVTLALPSGLKSISVTSEWSV